MEKARAAQTNFLIDTIDIGYRETARYAQKGVCSVFFCYNLDKINVAVLAKGVGVAYLRIANLKKKYRISRTEYQEVLKGVNVEFKRGELVAV